MAFGPGEYDELCTYVREYAAALGAIVIVLNGQLGSGFSVQAPPDLTSHLPRMLRDMAEQIERDTEK